MTDEKAVFIEVLRDKKDSVYSQRKKTGWGNRHGKAFAQPEESEAALRKRNGEIMEYKIGQKISWEEFKSYPVEMQKKYMEWLVNTFGATSGMFGRIVDRTNPTINNYFSNHRPELKGIFRLMPKAADLARFDAWLEGETETPVAETKKQEPVVVEKIIEVTKPELPYFVNTLQSGNIELCGTATEICSTLFGIFRDANLFLSVDFRVIQPEAPAAESDLEDDGLVNVNTCAFQDLRDVGIAANIASAIIKHRPYSAVEDLKTVEGIPPIAYTYLEKKVKV